MEGDTVEKQKVGHNLEIHTEKGEGKLNLIKKLSIIKNV